MRRTVDLIQEGRDAANLLDAANLCAIAELVRELAARLDHYAWAGSPPSTISPDADSSPASVKSALARHPSLRAAPTVPPPVQSRAGDDGGGEARLATAAMPLTGPEFSEPDPCPVYGVRRPGGPILGLVR